MHLTILPWLFWYHFLCCIKFICHFCVVYCIFSKIYSFFPLFSHYILNTTLMLVKSPLFCIFGHLTFWVFDISWFSTVWLFHFRNVSYKYWSYLNIFNHLFFYQHQKLESMIFHILSSTLTIKMIRNLILKFIKCSHCFLLKKIILWEKDTIIVLE